MNTKLLLFIVLIVLSLASCGGGGGSSSSADSSVSQPEMRNNAVAITMPVLSETTSVPTDELE